MLRYGMLRFEEEPLLTQESKIEHLFKSFREERAKEKEREQAEQARIERGENESI